MPQVDIAALLTQLTAANIALNQREVDRDVRAVVATAARVREDTIRAQVMHIEKCSGDEKPKLRCWIKDLTTLNTTHPVVTVAVGERTSRDNLSDTIESFLADAANAPRAAIAWPVLQVTIETLL